MGKTYRKPTYGYYRRPRGSKQAKSLNLRPGSVPPDDRKDKGVAGNSEMDVFKLICRMLEKNMSKDAILRRMAKRGVPRAYAEERYEHAIEGFEHRVTNRTYRKRLQNYREENERLRAEAKEIADKYFDYIERLCLVDDFFDWAERRGFRVYPTVEDARVVQVTLRPVRDLYCREFTFDRPA